MAGTSIVRIVVDTFAGRVQVEWDNSAPVSPFGQMPFFVEFVKQGGLFDGLVADCPLYFTSPNAPRKRDVNVKRAIERAMRGQDWHDAGCRWQGKNGELRLEGWSRHRRIVILRRRLERSPALAERDDSGQLSAGPARLPADRPLEGRARLCPA